MKSKTPALATEYRFPGSSERVVANNGEINASSKKDALAQGMRLMQATARGEVATLSSLEKRERAQKSLHLVQAMMTNDRVHREIGEVMGSDLYATANRRGISRKFLQRQELVNGQLPMVKLRRKDVTAIYATSPSKVESQIIRDKLFTVPEVILGARPFVEQNEINTSVGDVLEEKYGEALEALMVAEDRLWKQKADATLGIENVPTLISGTLTPQTLMEVRQQVAQWNLPVLHLFMASDLYVDIVGDSTFIQAIEPVSRHELIMTGELAVLYGMGIMSDGYRHEQHRVLGKGEFYAVSDPVTHGQYTDRGGIETEILTGATEKRAGKGWWVYESYSAVIANARSVAKGIRR